MSRNGNGSGKFSGRWSYHWASPSSIVANARTIHAQHNSLGLRDIELTLDAQPTIMFLGDSFVWGLDAEADERFTELLRPRIPGYKILAAAYRGTAPTRNISC